MELKARLDAAYFKMNDEARECLVDYAEGMARLYGRKKPKLVLAVSNLVPRNVAPLRGPGSVQDAGAPNVIRILE